MSEYRDDIRQAVEVLNRGGCTAFLEHRQTGPVVRIYAEKP